MITSVDHRGLGLGAELFVLGALTAGLLYQLRTRPAATPAVDEAPR